MEDFNRENFKRAEGLVKTDSLKNYKDSAKDILKTLRADGYDLPEATKFLEDLSLEAIKEVIKEDDSKC